jgi:hypothetical protein
MSLGQAVRPSQQVSDGTMQVAQDQLLVLPSKRREYTVCGSPVLPVHSSVGHIHKQHTHPKWAGGTFPRILGETTKSQSGHKKVVICPPIHTSEPVNVGQKLLLFFVDLSCS